MPTLNRDRLQRFQALLKDHGFDCYLACTPISMGYLAAFFEGGGERMLVMAVPPEGEPAMIVPALSETHARLTGIQNTRSWKDGEDPGLLFESFANEWGLKTAVIGVDDETPAGFLLRMQQALPAALFKCAGDVMAEVRKRKEPGELELMRRAARIADAALGDLLEAAQAGVTEAGLQKVLLSGMMDRSGLASWCIVAAGPNGAEPHHSTSDAPVKAGDVLVADWGCQVGHYGSDTTRTVCIGRAPDEAKKVYQVVHDAQVAAREKIRPGVPCQEIDRAAREVIEDAGYGEFFVHRTGHGIGMMGHEPPFIVEGSESPLEEGQCFSVEPGIYLPGRFGVRIENIVTVTSDGHESLNEEPSASLIETGV